VVKEKVIKTKTAQVRLLGTFMQTIDEDLFSADFN
jgi:hypothetical protein